MNQNRYIRKDIKNSLEKYKTLLSIIEENKYASKDRILTDIESKLQMTIEGAGKLFDNYTYLEGGLSTYIVKYKQTTALYEIKNLDDDILINQKIRKICNCSKSYFNSRLKGYGVKIKDIKENKDINIPLLNKINVEELEKNIEDIFYVLNELEILGWLDIKRTKVKIKNIDWNSALKIIFSRREYIYFEEENNLDKLINYDIFIQNYEQIENCNNLDEYNPLNSVENYFMEDEDEKLKRKIDFNMNYNSVRNIEIGDLRYFFSDRYKFKDVIDEFKLPKDLSSYKTVIYKTNIILRLLSRSDIEWKNYLNEFKKLLDDELERKVFEYMVLRENINKEKSIEDMYLELEKNYKNLTYEDVEDRVKSLILKSYISLV